MFPLLKIDRQKISENAKAIISRAKNQGIAITAVTKVTGGHLDIAKIFLNAGATALGESRIENLKNLSSLDCQKWLIRLPLPSEAAAVVSYSTLSLNSELSTISLLNEAAKNQGKSHEILYMVDLGDLREGLFIGDGRPTAQENQLLIDASFEKLRDDLKAIQALSQIKLKGVATNATCIGATIPSPQTFGALLKAVHLIEKDFGLSCEIVSGGNSSAWHLVENTSLPSFINNLRLGDVILFGRESAHYQCYDYLHQDAFILDVEILEVQDKPSVPLGEIGRNAFGEKPIFQNKGIRRRAICGLGRQDTNPDHLFPLLEGVHIEGASSDHLILDIDGLDFKVGDIISFRCDYVAALHAATSNYVTTKII